MWKYDNCSACANLLESLRGVVGFFSCHWDLVLLQKYLKKQGIDTIIHYPIPISELEGLKVHVTDEDLEISIINAKKILSLPMYPELEEDEIRYVCDNIKYFFYNSNLL